MDFKNKRNDVQLLSSRADTQVSEERDRNDKRAIKNLEDKINCL